MKSCARQCMRNSARLSQLGLPSIYHKSANTSTNVACKNKPTHRNFEDSESEYEPSHGESDEGGLIDDHNAKTSKEKSGKKTSKQTSYVPDCGVKFRSRKRVFAQQPSRATRSKKSIAQPDASLKPSSIAPSPSQPGASLTASDIPVAVEDDDLALHDDNIHMTTGVDAIPQPNGQNHMAGEDGFEQHDDNTLMADGADGSAHPGDNQMTNEDLQLGKERRERRVNMGHGLQRLTRARRGKLPLVITKGRTRPVVPLIAAKFATECNIAVRNHVPIFKHWKEYKKQPRPFNLFMEEFVQSLRLM